MQAASCVEALVERAEDHREHGAEGTMESADWIGERVGVLLDGCGNTRMCKLQQQGTARTQEYGGLPVYPPGDRSRTEYARERTGRRTPDKAELAFESVRAHNFEPITLRCRCHILTAWAASFARSRLVSAQIWRMAPLCQRGRLVRSVQRDARLIIASGRLPAC